MYLSGFIFISKSDINFLSSFQSKYNSCPLVDGIFQAHEYNHYTRLKCSACPLLIINSTHINLARSRQRDCIELCSIRLLPIAINSCIANTSKKNIAINSNCTIIIFLLSNLIIVNLTTHDDDNVVAVDHDDDDDDLRCICTNKLLACLATRPPIAIILVVIIMIIKKADYFDSLTTGRSI